MATRMLPRIPGAALRLLAVALVIGGMAAGADAKGGRRSGGSSSSHGSSSHSSGDKDGGSIPQINIRTNGSSGSGSSNSSGFTPRPGFAPGGRVAPLPGVAEEPVSEEERARRAANLEAYEKAMADKAAATRAANERAEAERLAAEKAAADRAAAKAAAERAETARLAAEKDRKRQEEMALQGEVDKVLQRAKADYPLLKTAEGEPLLRQILERQKALVDRGMYPSVAMVEAVADHASWLTPRQPKADAASIRPVSAEAGQAAAQAKAFGGCRWVSPTEWSCK